MWMGLGVAALGVCVVLEGVAIIMLASNYRALKDRLDEFDHEQLVPKPRMVRRDADKFRTL